MADPVMFSVFKLEVQKIKHYCFSTTEKHPTSKLAYIFVLPICFEGFL